MSTHRPLLCLGNGAGPQGVSAIIAAAEAEAPISMVLLTQGGPSITYVLGWSRDGGRCPDERWQGLAAIRAGERPPCTGVDLLHAVLRDAVMLDPQPFVAVWGNLAAFWEGKRRREWDVPADEVMRACQAAGLSGWVVVGGQAVRFEGQSA